MLYLIVIFLVFDGVFENNLLRFIPVRSPPLAQSTHAIPHNAMFRILRRYSPKGGVLRLKQRRERVHQSVPILRDIPTSVQVDIGPLEALRLGVHGGELLSQKMRLLLLREGLVYSCRDLRSDLRHKKAASLTQRRRLSGETAIAVLFVDGLVLFV